ncbi:hypothetical protein VOLCADRAFT_108266 [Volvox carteri f. nagariensis]|uniref:Uncharacterized protein n=1 Tax=Volvox carteri f. nagariensis TaxID=3068 RepID=D8UJ67_VOLCA|nr:uncharacterized protein VOLCADRAFT_108266 [Volvox carteri f. nagariensis]EFJ40219.1 hypothetical protein VOLCADRAFT_108266 [Volvox carteri f. nagariensis]|eukprot:XP_002958699.1 hypothetical protein VOLCADRAFT_108266 [Volvox carteri f. nagariensis]
MARLVQQAFLRWKMYSRFERTVKQLAAVVDPVADVLEKLPENRTPTDVQRLMPLIDAYRQLHLPVRELLASYLQLAVLTDRTELPRGPADHTCLFSVVYGSMTALMGDPADPALVSIRTFAAEQLRGHLSPETSIQRAPAGQTIKSDSTISLGGGGGGGGSAGGSGAAFPGSEPPPSRQSQLQSQSRRLGTAGAAVRVADGAAGAGAGAGAGGGGGSTEGSAESGQQSDWIHTRLWRTVIEIINKLIKMQKAQAVRELAAQHAAALEDMALSAAGRAASAAGGKAASAVLAAATGSSGGGAKAGAAAIGMGVLPGAAAEAGYLRLLPALSALRTQVVVIRTGQSFTGRELLRQDEGGPLQVDGGGHGDAPGRAVAAVVPKDSLVAVVFVSREVYHRAMAMQSEISVRRAVDCCCRLPFLRHTPLKELYRLSRHLQEVTFQPGEVVLHQAPEPCPTN